MREWRLLRHRAAKWCAQLFNVVVRPDVSIIFTELSSQDHATVGERHCLNQEKADLLWMSWECFCLRAEGAVTDCSTKPPFCVESLWPSPTCRLPWNLARRWQSPFIIPGPQTSGGQTAISGSFAFSFGFLIFNVPFAQLPLLPTQRAEWAELMTKETSCGISQSQKTWVVPLSWQLFWSCPEALLQNCSVNDKECLSL